MSNTRSALAAASSVVCTMRFRTRIRVEILVR
jgi:hypothetical protein